VGRAMRSTRQASQSGGCSMHHVGASTHAGPGRVEEKLWRVQVSLWSAELRSSLDAARWTWTRQGPGFDDARPDLESSNPGYATVQVFPWTPKVRGPASQVQRRWTHHGGAAAKVNLAASKVFCARVHLRDAPRRGRRVRRCNSLLGDCIDGVQARTDPMRAVSARVRGSTGSAEQPKPALRRTRPGCRPAAPATSQSAAAVQQAGHVAHAHRRVAARTTDPAGSHPDDGHGVLVQ
jgi:hypothetical protein